MPNPNFLKMNKSPSGKTQAEQNIYDQSVSLVQLDESYQNDDNT